jgi:GMP synthase-like glutamine amidotransferase
MKKLAIIQHHIEEDEGYIKQWILDNQLEFSRWLVAEQADFAEPQVFDGVLILGGEWNVKDRDSLDWMQREFDWIKSAFELNIPCFGICLGAQILARLLGATIHSMPVAEEGVKTITLNKRDFLLDFPLSQLMVNLAHGYRFDLPDNSLNYASSTLCEHQIFFHAHRPVAGIQCHLEWSAEMIQKQLPGLDKNELEQLNPMESRALLFYLLDYHFKN